MQKKILLITQYFPPEIGGGSQRAVGFAEELIELGANVQVIAPFPSYLMGKEKITKKNKLYESYNSNGIDILRTFVYANDRGGIVRRIFYYLSFTFSAVLVGFLKVKKIDYIITISPPLFNGLSGVLLSKLLKSKLIFDIGDLWPESAIALGYLTNPKTINLARKFEKWIYKNSEMVNLVTKLTKKKFEDENPFVEKTNYVPNFVKTTVIKKNVKDTILENELKLNNKLIFGYAGNVGSAQGIMLIIDSAKKLAAYTDIHFVIIGDGVDKPKIEKEINKSSLKNVLMLPPISSIEIPKYLSLFDVMIIPLVKNKLFDITIPSKLYESMAAEIPSILCVDGEARTILEEANCGLYSEPENVDHLVENVLKYYNDRNLIEMLGKNGLDKVKSDFSRKDIIHKFYKLLSKED